MKMRKWFAALAIAMLMIVAVAAADEPATGTDTAHRAHWSSCDNPGICEYCGAEFVDENPHHYGVERFDDETSHWEVCADCGGVWGPEAHFSSCDEPNVCGVCNRPGNFKIVHYGSTHMEHDEANHWEVCDVCGETLDRGAHYTLAGDPDGICSLCGTAFSAAATAAPTAKPTTAPTAAATKKPAASSTNSTSKVQTAVTAESETDGDSFLSRFQRLSALAADGDVFSGDTEAPLTLMMEPDEEGDYKGSELTVVPADSRTDGVFISLISRYESSAMLAFRSWQETMATTDELQATERYQEFIGLVRALIQALLPDMPQGDVDASIVAILASGFDGTLPSAGFSDEIDGEIVGYLALEDYELFLVLRGDSVELLVRDAE